MGQFDWTGILFFLIWGMFFFQGLFRRKKKKINTPEQPEEMRVPQSLPEKPSHRDTVSSHGKREGEYNFQELRKRILDSWGIQEGKKKTEEMDLPDEMEQEVYREEGQERKKVIRKKVIKKVVKKPKAEEASANSGQNSYRGHIPGKTEGETATAAISVKKETSDFINTGKSWTEEDLKKWVVYDAVFGRPRSKASWKPLSCRNEMNQ